MLSKDVKRLIETTDPSRNLVFVVFFDAEKEMNQIATISDGATRSRAMEQAIWKMKQPLMEAVRRSSHQGLQVLNDFEGSPTVVLSGPAHAWETLFLENKSFANDPRLSLMENSPSWRTAY